MYVYISLFSLLSLSLRDLPLLLRFLALFLNTYIHVDAYFLRTAAVRQYGSTSIAKWENGKNGCIYLKKIVTWISNFRDMHMPYKLCTWKWKNG